MKSKLLALATATAFAAGAGIVTPMSVFAATGQPADAFYFAGDEATRDLDAKTRELDAKTKDLDARTKDLDGKNKDLDAKLADAQARLEKAAHDVAELTSEIGGPLMDKFMVFNAEGPSRAIIGVQLDPESGKEGARIQEVSPGGPADEAGLHVGDVITSINGTEVKGDSPARRVMQLMHKVAPESKVNVHVTREGKPRDFVITARGGGAFFGLQHPPIPPMPPMPPGFPEAGISTFGPVMIHGQLGDMELASLTPQLGRYFGTQKGVLVVRAPKDFKLEDGDVILAIDGREPSSGSHATRILSSYQAGEKITIKVMRQQKTVNVETTLPDRMSFMGSGPDRKVKMIRKGANATT
ncbi:MAG: PDZ domain-containing protein [Steroidobacteraceae bacterium]